VLVFLGSSWFEQGRLAACNASPAKAFAKSADAHLEIVSAGFMPRFSGIAACRAVPV